MRTPIMSKDAEGKTKLWVGVLDDGNPVYRRPLDDRLYINNDEPIGLKMVYENE